MQLHSKIWLSNYEAEDVLGDIVENKKYHGVMSAFEKLVCAIII